MIKKGKHYLLLIIGILTILSLLLVYLFLYRAININIDNKIKISEQINNINENKRNEQYLLKINKDTEVDRVKLNSYILNESKVVNFIDYIESIDNKTNTKVDIVSINKDQQNHHINLNIDIIGDWNNINKALFIIENLPYSVNINNLEISKIDYRWKMNIKISVLYEI